MTNIYAIDNTQIAEETKQNKNREKKILYVGHTDEILYILSHGLICMSQTSKYNVEKLHNHLKELLIEISQSNSYLLLYFILVFLST